VRNSFLISYDLESTPLERRTASTIGSGDRVGVRFYSSPIDSAGGFDIRFTSPPQYRLSWCITPWTNFPVNLPTATDKVWRITKTRTSGITVVINCNEVEVLNILMSTCSNREWRMIWSREVANMKFTSNGTVSDYYRPAGANIISYTLLSGT
jgi:hypothetical protein